MKRRKLDTESENSIPGVLRHRDRVSGNSWKDYLPDFQLSTDYYFITFVTHNRQSLSASQKDLVFNAIRFLDGKEYELYAVAVLNDRLHMLINPFNALSKIMHSKIMHSIKNFTTHLKKTVNRKDKLWQGENFDWVIRDEEEFLEKITYIANDLLKENLATKHEDYKWLYIKGWTKDVSQNGRKTSKSSRTNYPAWRG